MAVKKPVMTVAPQPDIWPHVAHEAGRHHLQVDDAAQNPEQLARRLVGAVVETTEDVDVDGDEEERGAVGVQVAQQPARIDVAHDLLDRVESQRRVRGVVHGEHDAGQDLRHQHDREDAAEGVGVVQVARHRVGDERIVHEPRQRKARVEPALDASLRRIGGMSARHLISPLSRS
jgi:hypothetical protein